MASTTTTKKVTIKSSTYTRSGEKVTSLTLGLQTGSDHGLIARWKHAKSSQASGYRCDWEYAAKKNDKGNYIWLPGTVSTPSTADANVGGGIFRNLWTAPNNAIAVRVKVTPVSKTRNVNVSYTQTIKDGKVTKTTYQKAAKPYFKATAVTSSTHSFLSDKLAKPTITCTLRDNGRTWEVTVESADLDANYCDVQMSYQKALSDSAKWVSESSKQEKKLDANGKTTLVFTATAGKTAYFRARVQTTKKDKTASAWAYVEAGAVKPAGPTNPAVQATGADSVRFTWSAAAGAKSYKVEYVAGSKEYFSSNPGDVETRDGITACAFTPTGLDSAKTWWFRVCAVNDSGESAWSAAVSCVTATVPTAPTIYATEAAYMEGDDVYFRWVHNSEDNSDQADAQLEISHNGTVIRTISMGGDSGYLYSLDGVRDNTQVAWRVRTKGAHPDFSPWSENKSFTVYEQAALSAVVRQGGVNGSHVDDENPLTAFPLCVVLDASGGGNSVIGYEVSVVASETISYADDWGIDRYIAEGEAVWRGDFDTTYDPCAIGFGPGALDLSEGGLYHIEASVMMASGLSATVSSWDFAVRFDVDVPEPDADVQFDPDYLTATVTPACYTIDESTGEYTGTLRPKTTLAIYRIDSAGVIELLDRDIPNTGTYSFVDPHPPFGECWYHIVARDDDTGACSFADAGADSPHNSCVIQWGEGQVATDEDGAYTGKTLDGFVNETFNERGSVQKTLVGYAGRKRKVSYYGTDLGETAHYTLQFSRYDTEKLALARELKALDDDCHIREATGTAFWASIDDISISRDSTGGFFTLSIDATPVDRTDAVLDEGAEDDLAVTVTAA